MNPAVIALIGAIGGIVAAAVPVYITNRRHPSRRVADGTSIVDAAEGVVGLLRREVARLSKDVAALRKELADEELRTDKLERSVRRMDLLLIEYRRGVALLIAQIRELGHPPAWRPSDDDEPGGIPI